MSEEYAVRDDAGSLQRGLTEFAKSVVAEETRHRLGRSEEVVYDAKMFFVENNGTTRVLIMSPFAECPACTEVYERALALRLMAVSLDAVAVVLVAEGWASDRCWKCGALVRDEDRCPTCHTRVVAPPENPYRRETLFCTVMQRGQKGVEGWLGWIERDHANIIVGIHGKGWSHDDAPTERLMQPWSMEDPYTLANVVANLCTVREALGLPVKPEVREYAHRIARAIPRGFPLARVEKARVKAALTTLPYKVAIEPATHCTASCQPGA